MLAAVGLAQIQTNSATTPVSGQGISPLTPPSTYQNTLTPSRRDLSAYDQNLVNTGNVPGGRHFRGPMPYSSPLGGGSSVSAYSPADSLIRRSAGQPYIDRDPGRIQPYYNPRTNPSLARDGGLSPLTHFDSTRGISNSTIDSGIYRPRSMLSMSAAELERLSGIDDVLNANRLPTDLLLQSTTTIDPPGTVSTTPSLRPARDLPLDEKYAGQPRDPSLVPGAPVQPAQSLSSLDARELSALLEMDLAAVEKERLTDAIAEPDEQDDWPTQTKPARTDDKTASTQAAGLETPADPETKTPKPADTDRSGIDWPAIDPAEQRQVRGILGDHKNFEELAAAKVKEFTRTGDALMKKGSYYKAIDAYALAAVWDSRNAPLNLHRAVAHFGAGEFISAALFLERAVTLNPAYITENANLPAILPNKDVVDNRLIDGSKWQQESGSGEIAMLLAWVYRQQGQPARAAEAIRLAGQRLPNSPTVNALAKAFTDQ